MPTRPTTCRSFRFGVDLQSPLPGQTWQESARTIEALGYSTVFVPDHFDEGLGPIAALATAAAATTTLRVGTLVLACDFRHPAVLARELATVDLLSEGRLEVGLGAGWKPSDYATSGITMDTPGVRVNRLIEHTFVLRDLFGGGPVSFEGKHYRIDGLVGSPRPATAGGPPILIGGGGPRLLRFAGEAADIVGINASVRSGSWDTDTALDALPEAIDRKVEWVREGAGDRFDQLELSCWLAAVQITDDAVATASNLAALFGIEDRGSHELLDSPLNLIGTLDEMEDRLRRRRDRWGINYVVVPGHQAMELAPLVADLAGV